MSLPTITAAANRPAEAMLEALGGHGDIAILDHPVVESVMLRTKGFDEVLNAARESGKSTLRSWRKHPGRRRQRPELQGDRGPDSGPP